MWASRRRFGEAPDRIRFDGHVEVGVAMAAEICRRFRFSNDETQQIVALIENHMRFVDAARMKASTLKRFFRLEDLTNTWHCTGWTAWRAAATWTLEFCAGAVLSDAGGGGAAEAADYRARVDCRRV